MLTLYNIRPKGFNVGNDAIYLAMQHFVSQAFGDLVNIISIPATSRYESQAKAGLTAKTIHEINSYGDGIILGGGNIYENGELDVNIDALQALRVPLMLFSLSRGRIYDRYCRLVERTDVMPDRVLKALNEKADISLARDAATYEYLHNIGCDKVELGGCPTLFLDEMAYRLPPVNNSLMKTVFISVRNPSLMNLPLYKQATVRQDIVNIVNSLTSRGYEDIKLLCHDHRDIEFAASFTNIDFVYNGDVYSYLNYLRSCALVVGYRLHSTLPCLAFGIPTIKISYDERACSLLDTLGYHDWNINMAECDNVPMIVEQRLDSLTELEKIKANANSRKEGTYSCMKNAFAKFAKIVTDNKTRGENL
ncbi:MAG: polysaccharide pyruvyl transferase family protein [Negativicutes bacterium]|jgi:polysaccharide pyruvyl transferase WcaK-like protein